MNNNYYFVYSAILTINFYVCNAAVHNVLYVTVDDLNTEIGAYNGEAITPHMDDLARAGAVFQNAYAQMALCAPSRNSFLTSRRPDSLRLYDFYSYWRETVGNFTTLPQYLKDLGYHTYSIGKVFHPGESSNFTDDYPLSWSEPAWHPPTARYKDEPVCHHKKKWSRSLVCPVSVAEQPGGTLPDIESTRRAIAYLEERKGKNGPFFLALGYYKPHVPFKFPHKYLDLYPIGDIKLPEVRSKPDGLPTVAWAPWNDIRHRDDIATLNLTYPYGQMSDDWIRRIRQSYYASVSYIDDLLGQVLKSLQTNGFDRNTVVVIMGDHGWSLGEHGEWAKFSNYEIALKSPLIIKCPKWTSGTRINQPVELVDVFPTLVDVLGLPSLPKCSGSNPSACTEGESLLPLMLGRSSGDGVAFSQYPRPGVLPSKHPDSDIPRLNEITAMGYSVRTTQHRFTLWVSWSSFTPNWTDIKGTELYDHSNDPDENINLAGRPDLSALESRLRGILIQQFSKKESISGILSQAFNLDEEDSPIKRVTRLDETHTVVVDLNQVIHETDPRFLSFMLDTSFLRNHLSNFSETQWQNLTELCQSLGPAILRLGGTDADRLKFSETPEKGFVTLSENDWAVFNVFVERAKLNLLFDFNVLLRNDEAWDSSNAEKILRFSRMSGFKISNFQLGNEPNSFLHVFNFSLSPSQLAEDFTKLRSVLNSSEFYENAFLVGPDVTNPGLNLDDEELAASSKVPSSPESPKTTMPINSTKSSTTAQPKPSLSTSTVSPSKTSSKTTPSSLVSGLPEGSTTEPNETAIKSDPRQTSNVTVKSVITSTTQKSLRKRDTSFTKLQIPPEKYLRQFLENLKNFTLNAISWHHYYLNGRTATVNDFINHETLDSFAQNAKVMFETIREFSHDVPIWLTETGSAYGGGAKNLSDRYVSVFLLLDKLGMSAKLGIDLMIRQSLYGGSYAMLSKNLTPNPDFWVTLIFKKLIGTKVYSVELPKSDENLRFYAHSVLPNACLSNASLDASLVVFAMNLGKDAKNFDVKATAELMHCASYVFTPVGGNLQSEDILLNDRRLDWSSVRGKVGTILADFAAFDVGVLPPFSVGFFVFSSPQF